MTPLLEKIIESVESKISDESKKVYEFISKNNPDLVERIAAEYKKVFPLFKKLYSSQKTFEYLQTHHEWDWETYRECVNDKKEYFDFLFHISPNIIKDKINVLLEITRICSHEMQSLFGSMTKEGEETSDWNNSIFADLSKFFNEVYDFYASNHSLEELDSFETAPWSGMYDYKYMKGRSVTSSTLNDPRYKCTWGFDPLVERFQIKRNQKK